MALPIIGRWQCPDCNQQAKIKQRGAAGQYDFIKVCGCGMRQSKSAAEQRSIYDNAEWIDDYKPILPAKVKKAEAPPPSPTPEPPTPPSEQTQDEQATTGEQQYDPNNDDNDTEPRGNGWVLPLVIGLGAAVYGWYL